MSLRLATSQFPTSADAAANAEYMVQQISEAARQGADLVHFPEACLSGYADHDLESYEGVQADIFDHLLAVMPFFELRVFQHPTGENMKALKGWLGSEMVT